MKKKVRFLLPVILCCLLVCGTAAGSHYAQGVSLMEQALAAEEAYQSAGVVSAEELSQALEGEEALSTEEILDAAEQVRRSASPELEPYFTGSLEERFSQNCREGLEAPLEWGFSVDRGFTNPKLLVGSPSPAQRPRCVSGRILGLAPSIPISWRGRPATQWRCCSASAPTPSK